MGYAQAVVATTDLDLHGERMSLAALVSLVEQANRCYIPVGWGHDPRVPPAGRATSASLRERPDGEYEVVATIETFDCAEAVNVLDPNDPRSIPIPEHGAEIEVCYDRGYRDLERYAIVQEIARTAGSSAEPVESLKKALDPTNALVIGLAVVLGEIGAGFLRKVGSDGWDLLKKRLRDLFAQETRDKASDMLVFEFTVDSGNLRHSIEVVIPDPASTDLPCALDTVLANIDSIIAAYAELVPDLRRLVLEYAGGAVAVRFGVRKDGVPLFPVADAEPAGPASAAPTLVFDARRIPFQLEAGQAISIAAVRSKGDQRD